MKASAKDIMVCFQTSTEGESVMPVLLILYYSK